MIYYNCLYKNKIRYNINIMSLLEINNIIDSELIKFSKDNKSYEFIKNAKVIINNNKDIDKNFIYKRIENINNYRNELSELFKIPVIEQRTLEWFEARETRLTASDLSDAIKNNNNSDKLAKKKAKIIKDNINYNAVPALKWGTMFEPMATRCYSQINNNIIVYDFGLICDKNNKHFGASPDGINELGIMIEIKCPYSRKIVDGYIPEKYKMQIQGQLAVCNLKECDYVECEFKELDASEYYNKYSKKKIDHGIIAEYYHNNTYSYLYSDASMNAIETYNNIQSKIASNNGVLNKLIYWELVKLNIQRETFDPLKWKEIVPKIDTFWEKVEKYKLCPIEDNIKKINFIDDND